MPIRRSLARETSLSAFKFDRGASVVIIPRDAAQRCLAAENVRSKGRAGGGRSEDFGSGGGDGMGKRGLDERRDNSPRGVAHAAVGVNDRIVVALIDERVGADGVLKNLFLIRSSDGGRRRRRRATFPNVKEARNVHLFCAKKVLR